LKKLARKNRHLAKLKNGDDSQHFNNENAFINNYISNIRKLIKGTTLLFEKLEGERIVPTIKKHPDILLGNIAKGQTDFFEMLCKAAGLMVRVKSFSGKMDR